eukprot:1644871-Rhodomonas_salina.1
MRRCDRVEGEEGGSVSVMPVFCVLVEAPGWIHQGCRDHHLLLTTNVHTQTRSPSPRLLAARYPAAVS